MAQAERLAASGDYRSVARPSLRCSAINATPNSRRVRIGDLLPRTLPNSRR
jgi:hypothetical protein